LKLKEKEIQNLEEKVEKLEGATNQLAQDKLHYQTENHALKEKVHCVPQCLDMAVKRVGQMFGLKERQEKMVQLKEKDVIPDSINNVICDLVSLDNIPTKCCVDTFKCIARGLGLDIEGDIDTRSVNQIVKEGSVAANIHLVKAFQTAKGTL